MEPSPQPAYAPTKSAPTNVIVVAFGIIGHYLRRREAAIARPRPTSARPSKSSSVWPAAAMLQPPPLSLMPRYPLCFAPAPAPAVPPALGPFTVGSPAPTTGASTPTTGEGPAGIEPTSMAAPMLTCTSLSQAMGTKDMNRLLRIDVASFTEGTRVMAKCDTSGIHPLGSWKPGLGTLPSVWRKSRP